uniref:SLH domain-containing protein n=3 Tax=Manihot esculenta TaxID=3983 RepID=A0A2C9VNP1_MANES
MCSSASAPPSPALFLCATSTRSLSGRLNHSPYPLFRSNRPTILRLSASVAGNHLDLSWFSPAITIIYYLCSRISGFSTILLAGGTCTIALIAAIAYFSLSREVGAEQSSGSMPEESGETITSVYVQKLERVKVPVPVDSAQLESLLIIEDYARAEELCTRREYARWLVRLSSLLERNPKHRIVPSMLLSGSVVAAFDDVSVEDSDFDSIQALAEAGIASTNNYCSDSSKGDLSSCFYPDRYGCIDLINWKAQLEYIFMSRIIEQMSRIKVDYMDVKDISSDASPELLIDMLAGDKGIIRKVFGQSRRFQPNKPLTKAQAAVALTSGRMTETVNNEILRLEAENSSRQVAMKEIRSEVLDKGDIERFWDEKMKEERARGLEIQNLYIAALRDLEFEKSVEEKALADHLKGKAAMDCQRQLLLGLKEEVDEMSERLTSERSTYVDEQCNLQELLSELQTKQEVMRDKKSVAEAEIEALRILRSWVEDEARKCQARAEVLEEIGRRWKPDNQA